MNGKLVYYKVLIMIKVVAPKLWAADPWVSYMSGYNLTFLNILLINNYLKL